MGGTALALSFRHRISVDLDLFTNSIAFDKEEVIETLTKEFGNEFEYNATPGNWCVFSFIQNVKVDIVKYNHPLITATEEVEEIKT